MRAAPAAHRGGTRRGQITVGASAERVGALRGLGPKSAAMLADAGFATAGQVRAADPFAVYARVKRVHPAASLNLLYALIGAIEGRDWRDVARNDRTSVLLRLDGMGLAP